MALKILIIDDDESFRHLVQLRLKQIDPDLNLTIFDNITEARSFLKMSEEDFDLVVLDQHLPDGRGLELLQEGHFEDLAVLAVSSDDNPTIPGATIQAGAKYFLNKMHISEPLFKPLVQGILDRNRLMKELHQAKLKAAQMGTIKTLVGTLKHEINNPLGAVLGSAYLIRTSQSLPEDQKKAAEVIESSGKRIQHVLQQLAEALSVEAVIKGEEEVFHIPGDKPWSEDNE